jgi:hypothetical protein
MDLAQQVCNGDEKAKSKEAAAGAISVTGPVGDDGNHAQHGGYGRDVRICVALPGRRKTSYIKGDDK